MAAGPRDTPPGRDTATGPGMSQASRESHERHGVPETHATRNSVGAMDADEQHDRNSADENGGTAEHNEVAGPSDSGDPLEPLVPLDELEPLGSADALPSMEEGQSFRELRPARLLRIWQLAPITALTVGGSLMFAFPLAFESGDAGPVVAMLGLLLCLCAAGWGLMAARRAGQTWPGLPPRGSGGRPDWRYVTGYTVVIALLALLAVWRVARLR
jgi:hypothetical protein